MDAPIRKHHGEIRSLNIDDLDVAELGRRLERAVASVEGPTCTSNKDCCPPLAWCGNYSCS